MIHDIFIIEIIYENEHADGMELMISVCYPSVLTVIHNSDCDQHCDTRLLRKFEIQIQVAACRC